MNQDDREELKNSIGVLMANLNAIGDIKSLKNLKKIASVLGLMEAEIRDLLRIHWPSWQDDLKKFNASKPKGPKAR
jgi:hypothetical protein